MKTVKQNSKIYLLAGAATLALLLAGCGDKSESKATQVAAKVNGDEITVHQINFALTRLNNPNAAQNKDVANQVLKGLIDKQLLIQQAIEEKLDRDPNVAQAIEESRRQVLAAAYVDRLTQNTASPTEDEIKAYFDKHPALFSERRIYRLGELAIQTTPEQIEEVKSKLAEAKGLPEIMEWLKARNIPARFAQTVKPAEQLPLELLPRLHALKEGQALNLVRNNGITLLAVTGIQSQPLSLEQAKPLIERFIANNHKRESTEAKLTELRKNASIEYKGDYKEAGTAAAAAAAAPAPAQEAPNAAQSNQDAMGKGLQGLK